jgi:hypothetical protein
MLLKPLVPMMEARYPMGVVGMRVRSCKSFDLKNGCVDVGC